MDASLEQRTTGTGSNDAKTPKRGVRLAAGTLILLLVAGVVGYLVQGEVLGGGSKASVGSVAAPFTRASSTTIALAPAAVPSPVGHEVLAGQSAPDHAVGGTASSSRGVASSDTATGSRSQVGTIPGANEVPGVGAKVIRTAAIGIVVARGDFAEDFQKASTIATTLGGFVSSSDAQTRSGSITVRVPASRFDRARAQLTGLGVQTIHEEIHGQDVTAQFVDLKARLQILQAREAALVTLLRKATSLSTILRLQNAVDDVRTQIEQFKGQVNLINNQTAYATITLSMREQGQSIAPPADRPSLADAWSSAVAGFLRVISLVVIGLGYVIPLAAIGAGAAWVLVRLRRRGVPAAGPSDG